jgi:hypothetical protein
MGGSMLAPRDCGNCRDRGYLGYVVNYTATPLTTVGCTGGRNKCEMPRACQDRRGASIWISLAGRFENDECDARSDNPFNCHHKPEANQVGLTTFTSCPFGVRPPNPQCVSKVIDVQPDGPREVR